MLDNFNRPEDTGLPTRSEYDGPERRDNYHPKRKMVLTDEDVAAIAKVVENRHVCRYDIPPDDMKELMAFVKVFHQGAVETRGAIRSFIIRKVIPWAFVVGVLSLLEAKFRWMRPLLRYVVGMPQ